MAPRDPSTGRFTKRASDIDPTLMEYGTDISDLMGNPGTPLNASDASHPIGVGGLKQTSGLLMEEFDPALKGDRAMRAYREMRDNNGIIAGVTLLFEKYLQGAEWTVDPFEADVPEFEADAQFVRDCMDDMNEPWSAVTADVWSELQFGWAFLEPTYKPRNGPTDDQMTSSRFTDGKWGWAELAYRAQETRFRWVFDERGRVLGWIQRDYMGRTFDLPMAKGILFRTSRAKGNPEGRSLYRSAFRDYWFIKRLEEIEGIGLERNLTGMPVVYIPPDVIATGGQVYEDWKAMARDIRIDEQMGAVLPAVFDGQGNRLYELALLASPGRAAIGPNEAIMRHALHMTMAMLGDAILVGHEGTGSLALAETKQDTLEQALQSILDDACDTFNRQEIPRLFRLNGNTTGQLPKLMVEPPSDPQILDVMQALNQLAGAGAPLFPNPELSAWVREQTGIPVLDEFADVQAEDVPPVPGTKPTPDAPPVAE